MLSLLPLAGASIRLPSPWFSRSLSERVSAMPWTDAEVSEFIEYLSNLEGAISDLLAHRRTLEGSSHREPRYDVDTGHDDRDPGSGGRTDSHSHSLRDRSQAAARLPGRPLPQPPDGQVRHQRGAGLLGVIAARTQGSGKQAVGDPTGAVQGRPGEDDDGAAHPVQLRHAGLDLGPRRAVP